MANRIVIKPATVALILVGILLVIVAIVYFATPAKSLPGFFPGHQAGLSRRHLTHGSAALVLALLVWVGAWFTTGPSGAQRR